MADDLLLAGRVGRPHGLDGSFYVTGAKPLLLTVGAELVVAGRRRRIVRRAGDDRRPIVRLEECQDRAEAELMRGQQLLISRERLPELEEGEWWAEDLEGCRVHDGPTEVGRVRRVLGLPSCEVLEVHRQDRADLLVPLVADAVREVDVEAKEIDVDLRFLGEA